MENQAIIFHIDVNSAFLSWSAIEHLKNGETTDLRQIPSAVGGDSATRHGIILAKSIPAKEYHIETGEPIVTALRKCPMLTVVSPNMKFYKESSDALMDYLSQICPRIEQVSIDECYLDYSYISNDYPSPLFAATQIKDDIYKTFGFSVNIGISDRKVLAKMASDFKKPNLVHTLYHSEIEQKMWPLPVSSLFMCGNSSTEALRNLELLTIGDLAKADINVLTSHLKSHGALLWEYANGIDSSKVECIQEPIKGIGNSTTVSIDITSLDEAKPVLLMLAEKVSGRLRKSSFLCGCVTIEIKYATFQSVSKQALLSPSSSSTKELYALGVKLFIELWNHQPIRLLGLRSTKLVSVDEPVQMSLFDYSTETSSEKNQHQKQAQLEASLDKIRNKYGKDAIVRGTFLRKKTSNDENDDS